MPNNRLIPFKLFNSNQDLTDANQVTLDSSGFTGNLDSNTGDVQDLANTVDNLSVFDDSSRDALAALLNSRSTSGRGFQRVNSTTLTINNLNLADFADTNTLYAAGIDKIATWTLPTDADIAATAGVDYPVVMEITHIGGTARIPAPPNQDSNRLNLDIAQGDSATISTSTGLINLPGIDLLQDDVVVLSKESAGGNWFANRSLHDPSTRILPEGTFEFSTQKNITNIADIATELSGVTINAGDAFIIDNGGDYFGETINNNDVIVALISNPGLTTNDGDDWLILENGAGVLTNDQVAFFNNVARDGTRFDLSQNVFVNDANVRSFSSQASGTPLTLNYSAVATDGATARSVSFPGQALQFTALEGGTLSLAVGFSAISTSGFPPELTSLTFAYGGTSFIFPLTNIDAGEGAVTVDIDIANQDYSGILNSNCDITLDFNFRGSSFVGSFTIQGLTNTLDGTLRQSVTDIADNSALLAEQRMITRLDQLSHRVDDDGSDLEAIRDRISPYRNVTTRTPDIHALFLDSTGSDAIPALSSMSQVSADNPRFTGGDVALYVAVIEPANYALRNISKSTDLALQSSEATVSVVASSTLNNNTYFIYQVTGLTANDVYEVERTSAERVVAWPADIDTLQEEIDRIDAELSHAALNLPDSLVDVLDNAVSVTEQSNAVRVATDYNNQLAGPTNTTQTVFFEPNPKTPSGGTLESNSISATTGDRNRRKLAYIDPSVVFGNAAYLTATDGTTSRDIVTHRDGEFYANVFVPAIPASTRTETIYPAPATRVSGEGIWINIPTLTFVNGVPVPEADEVFFTRNIPTSSTNLTIQYRGHANGNVFGESSTTLAGVGGGNEVVKNFTLDDGGESATVEVRWYPSTRRIRVSVVESVHTGLPTINDIDVILSFTEDRTVPSTPATTREVLIEQQHTGAQVFAIKPSTDDTLILVGDRAEVDTQWPYTTLFDTDLSGNLILGTDNGLFLDYEDFTPIPSTITDLENHASLPQMGLFTTQYDHQTIVNFDTQLTAKSGNGSTFNVVDKNCGQLALSGVSSVALASADTDQKITGTYTDYGVNRNFTTSVAGVLTNNGPSGMFLINGVSDLEVNNAARITYKMYVNGSPAPNAETPHDFNTTSKLENVAITQIVNLQTGDEIEVYVSSDTANRTVTVADLVVTIVQI